MNNIQKDVLNLLELYAKMPYENHGYINPHILSMLFEVVNFGDSELESSSTLDNWYENMWSQ